jgi:uncharacterized protein with HEPN domain
LTSGHKRSLDALTDDILRWIGEGNELAAVSDKGVFASATDFHAANWCVLCVGEAAGNIIKSYPGFAEGVLKRELSMASAARNRIVHGYYNLDEEVVQSTIQNSFPLLLGLLQERMGLYKAQTDPEDGNPG